MHLRSLYLQQFRSYREAFFEFNPSLNFICGPNAQGKTTILEAIYYLMFGRSFRPSQHTDLILENTAHFYIKAHFSKHGIDQELLIYADKKERKMEHNTTPLRSLSSLLGLVQGIVMTPDDANLIKGSPSERRRFLDSQIAQADSLYVHHLTRYHKAMRQRNALLKNKDESIIAPWEHEMAHAASYIILQRKKTVEALQIFCQNFYSYLTDESEELSLHYRSGASACQTADEIKAFYLQQFPKYRQKEMIVGHTLIGPHKDDLIIAIGGKDGRYFASEGQQRSLVTALHIAAWNRLKETLQTIQPLWMIDDIGISLDHKRREKLIEHLSSMGQVFITTTEPTMLDTFKGSKKIFNLPFLDI